MAFRTAEVAVHLSSPNDPPECTCTIASLTTGGACPAPSSKDDRSGAKAGYLSTLKLQLHQTLSQV